MESQLNMSRSVKAFTLAELLIALVVTGIVLSAVATLAFAMSSASRDSDDVIVKQAQLRQARLRIAELIRHSKLICAAPGNDLAVWRADDNDDGQINVGELVYIERGSSRNMVRLCQFSPTETDSVPLANLRVATMKAYLVSRYLEVYVPLIPACSDVQFDFHGENPPFTRWLTVSFELSESGVIHRYEMSAALRAWAGNLLNADGTALVDDDD